jgi:hypothetical protein
MPMITEFIHQNTLELHHQGDCSILGLAPDEMLYIEEFYDEYIAQHQIHQQKIISSIDEDAGQRDIVPFKLPEKSIIPNHPSKHPLNYRGVRLRGLREAEHLQDWILPLSVMEKVPLLAALGWALPPMMLLGIAESHVLAQCQIGESWLLCRRLRLAYAHERRLDDDGLPYDYDSREIYLLHQYAEDENPVLHEALSFAGIVLQKPMDLLYSDGKLILADGAVKTYKSRLIWWEKSQ